MEEKVALDNDALNRKEFINKFLDFIDSFGEQGLTLVLNGKYGSGKSTVLNMIEEQNKTDNKYTTLIYNAWEDNIFDNPMIPLLGVLKDLTKEANGDLDNITNKLTDKLLNVTKIVGKTIVKTAVKVVEGKIGIEIAEFENYNTDILKENKEYKENIKKYKDKVKRVCRDKKAVLFIDELDRCLPEYQIKVLETVYHLLGIPNLTVVIALDKEQLEKTIETKFGDAQNTHGYLAKFIDYEFDLPRGTKDNLLVSKIEFKNTNFKDMMIVVLNHLRLENREVIKLIRQLNVIMFDKNSPDIIIDDYAAYYIFLLLIVRKYNFKLFNELMDWFVGKNNCNPMNPLYLDRFEYLKREVSHSILKEALFFNGIIEIDSNQNHLLRFIQVFNIIDEDYSGHDNILCPYDRFDNGFIRESQVMLAPYINKLKSIF